MTVQVTRGTDAWVASWESERASALSVPVVEGLHGMLDEASQDRVPALVLRGGTTHFSSGFDLHDLAHVSDAELAHRFLRIGSLLDRLAGAPFLTVAVASGAAVGAGADLVAACDRRLALASASFAFPGSRFGVVLGTRRLAAVVGSDRALGLVGGRRVRAAEAGFVEVYDDADALERGLASVIRRWSRTDAVARPGLLSAARPGPDDSALAELARSVLRPGLGQRIREATSDDVRPKQPTDLHSPLDLKEPA